MGSEYTFYDYIDTGETGQNIINSWLNGDAKEAKAYFNRIIGYLEGSPPPGSQDSVWHKPYAYPLHNAWNGFIEIRRKVKGLQYRLIGMIDVRNVLLVTWGYHRGGKWETDITPKTAKERIKQMQSNPIEYRRLHDNR